MSTFVYRIRSPPGLENTLIKDLKWQLALRGKQQSAAIYKVPGRKILEIRGDEKMMWHILSKSRIAEDLQVRACHSFMARGEKELESNLQKVPWHVYMPSDEKHVEF